MSFINYTQLDDKFQTPCKHFNDHKTKRRKKFRWLRRVLYIKQKQTHAKFVDFFNKVWLNKLSREPGEMGGESVVLAGHMERAAAGETRNRSLAETTMPKTNLERTKLQIK